VTVRIAQFLLNSVKEINHRFSMISGSFSQKNETRN
jgi:hypothetical protein